jgi:hypothetical protein
MPDPLIIGGGVVDPDVDLLFGETDYLVGMKRVGPDGLSVYDRHPSGEGNENPDLWHCCDCTDPIRQPVRPRTCPRCGSHRFRRGRVFTRIRCRRSQVPQFWKWEEHEPLVEKVAEGVPLVVGGVTYSVVNWRFTHPKTGEQVGPLFPTPDLTAPKPRLIVDRLPVVKLDRAVHNATRRRHPNARPGANVYTIDSLRVTAGTMEDFLARRRMLDTHANALLDVGPGRTYGTIQAAEDAASSGDAIAVYADTYTENVVVTGVDGLQLIGVGGVRQATVTASSGIVLSGTASKMVVRNLSFVGTGTVTYVLRPGGHYGVFESLFVSGGSVSGLTTYGLGVKFRNCGVTGAAADNIQTGDSYTDITHCTSKGAGDDGIAGTAFGPAVACISCDNGGTDFDIGATAPGRSAWNAGEDDVVGGGSVTGFAPAELDSDLKLTTTTPAAGKFDGMPVISMDGWRQIRKPDSLVFFAGWHDPDPTGAAPGAPAMTASVWA